MLKVPATAQNILLDTLPKVHKSGHNSPTSKEIVPAKSSQGDTNREKLEEKLMIASVCNATITTSPERPSNSLESSIEDLSSEPLLDRTQFRGYIKTFGAPKNEFLTFNGSDCELNLVVLLLCILAICLIIPFIYTYMAYHYPDQFSHSKYDDTDLHQLHHINDVHSTTKKLSTG